MRTFTYKSSFCSLLSFNFVSVACLYVYFLLYISVSKCVCVSFCKLIFLYDEYANSGSVHEYL